MEKLYWEKYVDKELLNTPFGQISGIFFVNSPISEYYSPEIYFYKKNQYGYRSLDFDDQTDILTVGCSNTFGVGLPFEYTWPKILEVLIPNINIKNLSIPGMSAQFLISKIFNYINEFNAPKVIVCLFPSFERYTGYNSSADNLETFYTNQTYSNQNKKDFLHENLVLYLNFEYIKMLESLCKSLNIKLIWSFWNTTTKLFDYSKYENNFKEKKFFDYIENNKYVLKNNFNSFYYPQVEPDFFNVRQNCQFNSSGVLEYKKEFVDMYFNNKDYRTYKENIKPEKNKDIITMYESLGHSYDVYSENLFNQFEDCLDFAHDRYKVPSFYKDIEIQKTWSKEKMNKIKKETMSRDFFFAHPGLRFNIFWAEEMAKAIYL